jgi:hypothetical protein
LNKYNVWPTSTFIVVILAGFGARMVVGRIYSASKAVDLLGALTESGLFLGSAAATAAATILALMLTLTGLVKRSDHSFSRNVYQDVLKVASHATIALLISLALLLALAFPTTDFDNMPAQWYPRLYDGLFAGVVLTIAMLATTVVRLYLTIRCVVGEWSHADDDD